MYWARQWSKAVTNASSRKGWNLFSNHDFAHWYDIQLEHSNYPGALLEIIKSRLSKETSLLDIGAGTGAFAVPMARVVNKVTAVEPSLAMAKILLGKMNGQGNIHVVNQCWEDIKADEMGSHDMVLAVNSLYRITDIVSALKKMIALSRKHLFIIMSCKSSFYNDIWHAFKEEAYRGPPSFLHLYNVLCQLHIFANIEMVKTKYNHVYADMDQAVNYWETRLNLGLEQKNSLRAYLGEKLIAKNGALFFAEQVSNAVIWVEK